MKIVLKGLKNIEVSQNKYIQDTISPDWVSLNVLYCAICRTDAKLWKEGHRDLALPRIPGHEIVAEKDGKRYVIWPGIVCGECKYCISGNENLCEKIEIIGFHMDGGFSNNIIAPKSSLIPLPENISSLSATFSEPVGCIVNAFRKLKLKQDDRILIYGAGTVGLLSALLSREYGAIPVVIENSETKIAKAKEFTEKTEITVLKETNESHFDCVINACSDPIAFINSITRADKGGRIVHFSGLSKNEQIESNLLNLVHYKELQISGSYGLTKRDMESGLSFIEKNAQDIEFLIERTISPLEVEDVLLPVINGEVYKYVIDFSNSIPNKTQSDIQFRNNREREVLQGNKTNKADEKIFGNDITIPSDEIITKAKHKIDFKTKPLGALGLLEDLAVRMSTIQNNLNPVINRKVLFTFAADHGIAEEGVSAFPQEVTRQMVENFLKEGAAINVLCKHNNIDLSIIDIGVKGPIINHPNLIEKRIAEGTNNFALENAMSIQSAEKAIQCGADIFNSEYDKQSIDILGLGEMGIANTSTATAIISAITQKSVIECTGRGTGVDNQGLEHKIKVITKALDFHKPNPTDAFEILSKIGGFEIAGMAGAALAAAAKKSAIVLDGLISTAAGLIAYTINPDVAHYFIAGHKSVEKGHLFALNHIGITPILDLNMRLGEGTGAALTIDLVDASCRIMRDMASFDDAGISKKLNKNG